MWAVNRYHLNIITKKSRNLQIKGSCTHPLISNFDVIFIKISMHKDCGCNDPCLVTKSWIHVKPELEKRMASNEAFSVRIPFCWRGGSNFANKAYSLPPTMLKQKNRDSPQRCAMSASTRFKNIRGLSKVSSSLYFAGLVHTKNQNLTPPHQTEAPKRERKLERTSAGTYAMSRPRPLRRGGSTIAAHEYIYCFW